MLGGKTIRKLLLTAVVVALAATPVGAEVGAKCKYKPKHFTLHCKDGPIYVCEDSGGNCAVSCGKKFVNVPSCGNPE